MSDVEFSASGSEPVSDVNPEEMARLMADLDDMDDNLLKPTPAKKDDKDTNRRVTFNEKSSSSSKSKAKVTKNDDDDDEDWDADDLLYSDDENRKGKTPQKLSSGAASTTSTKIGSPSKKAENNEAPAKTGNTKRQLMADLFSDESPKKDSVKKSTISAEEPKRDKSKLMSDLFGGDDTAKDSNAKKSPVKKSPASAGASSRRSGMTKKAKDEVSFDDDDDDILGGIGDSKPKGRRPVSDTPQSSGFLDSLLGKSSTTEKSNVIKEKSPEFVLDDKYKNMGKEKKEDRGFGGYMPSSGKADSPRQRTPQKTGSSDPFDFLNDSEPPRRRNPRSATQRKAFEIDDDDILGNVRSRKGKSKEVEKEPAQTGGTSTKSPSSSAKSKDTDWLFGSSGSADEAAKKAMDEASVKASVDQESAVSKNNSPNKSQDWLGNLLSSNKKSPSKPLQNSSNANSLSIKPSSPAPSNVSPLMTTNRSNVHLAQKLSSDVSTVVPVPPNVQQVDGQKIFETSQQEFLMQQQLAEAQTAAAVAQMKAQQEQLLQQQEAKLKSASLAASEMKAQQNQLEAQMAQQLMQQQQEMAKLQESAMKRYQETMSSSVTGFNFNPSVADNKSDESMKELQIQLRSSEVDVARLTAELELIRKQHVEEVAILEESFEKRHNMEKDVWERTEQRLKEERNNLLSEFQSKIVIFQAEKESMTASHEVQLASVKKEWSQVVERTKELYTEMAERMKVEHSAALERMTYLKNLELNAAVSASGHVKEVEAVMTQLESNTANLSDLTSSINMRQDAALEITQRALKLKEKQLKDFEAQLEASRAEAECERGRLNALITRLESTLIQQGTEVEKERWRLTQEQMKMEMERKSLMEERRHLQVSLQAERQNLASARESLLSEHQIMLQSVAQEKHELVTQRAQHSAQQRVNQVSSFVNFAPKNNQLELDAEMTLLNDEHRRLQEKMAALMHREKCLDEEEERLDQLNSKLEQDKVKIAVERDFLSQEKLSLKKMQEEADTLRQTSQSMRGEQQIRLSQITAQTQTLHTQQERLEKERLRLDQTRDEINRLVQLGQCPSCQNRGVSRFLLDTSSQQTFGRLPGDGGEGQTSFSKLETSHSPNMSPASVLARLVAARERENMEREKRLMQISALESS